MLSPNAEEIVEAIETPADETPAESPAPEVVKPKVSKSRQKGAKPKSAPSQAASAAHSDGPIYLLLNANGKYKELSESELEFEAAGIFKDPTLRLVKAQFMTPQISFKVSEA